MKPMDGINDDDMKALEEIVAERHGADNRNDTVDYWRTRAITAEGKIREFAEQLEQLQAAPEPAGELRELLTAVLHALRSYQYGNASTELAEEMANALEAALQGRLHHESRRTAGDHREEHSV